MHVKFLKRGGVCVCVWGGVNSVLIQLNAFNWSVFFIQILFNIPLKMESDIFFLKKDFFYDVNYYQ